MKPLITIAFLFAGLTFSFAQDVKETKSEEDQIIDALFNYDEIDNIADSFSNFQFLYLSLNYSSNTYFSGRDIGIDQFNLIPQITYFNSNGLFASLSGIYYSKFVPKWDYTTVTLGYGKKFGKSNSLRYFVDYSRYIYSNSLDNLFKNNIELALSYHNNKNTLGTQLSVNYLFGKEQSFIISSRNFASFELLKTKKSTLKFKPQVNITMGQQTIELAQTVIISGSELTDYTQHKVFGMINTQIEIPLLLNTHNFDFELGYNLNIPSAFENESNLKTTGYFNVSLAYLMDL
ncbi:MAG: hypothetical protein L3J45_05455 [Flavobacteriaceae bacterium]|nr:hypothetical protein [Flavobacteriaceae bacterium]